MHEFITEFTLDSRTLRLQELAEYYHTKTDEYDKKICTGKCQYDGSPMPATNYQFIKINIFAKQVLSYLYDIGIREGFTKSDISNAVREYSKM